jgi:TPR repeat protein
VKWYKLGAEQGVINAQVNLGVKYASGQGVIQDMVYAHMWANFAASSGDENAVNFREALEEKMTSAEIAEAQKFARECVEKNYKGC